jgi:signal transduction histidine kinase
MALTMKSLFLKIFLWFWSAMALVVLSLVVSILWTQPKDILLRMHPMMDPSTSVNAQTAADVYGRTGEGELSGNIHRMNAGQSFLFDKRGVEVLSLHVASPQVFSQVRSSGIGQRDLLESHVVAGEKIVGPSGRAYVMEVLPDGRFLASRPLMLLGPEPYSFALRLTAVLLTGGIVCYWLARYLAAPVVHLRDAAHKLAAGDLKARVGAAGRRRDELTDLCHDFDQMAERIESVITAQGRLLVDVSHELRSPLARLTVAAGLIRQRLGAAAPTELDRIELEADRINVLIRELLILNRIESGTQRLEKEEVNLVALIKEVAGDADFEARSLFRSVRIVRQESLVTLGIRELLRSAIENVVRNAVRYTLERTLVEVSLHSERKGGLSWAVIAVRDHGQGVPDSALEDIFQPFYRVSDARERDTGGSGLGLSITERAVRLHGGTVQASNHAGGGLVVEIRLPTAI